MTGAPSCSSTATVASPVGSYPITCAAGTLAATNYSFGFTAGSLSVTKAPLTVTADNASKTQGTANPTFTATITGFVLAQTLATSGVTGAASCTSTATTASPAGTYPITCVTGTLASANYSFSFAPGTLTVTTPKLVFTTAPQPLLTRGVSSATITVQRQTVTGSALTSGSLTVSLATSPAGSGVFRNTADTSTITTVTIANGASSASFRYRPSATGSPTLTVSATGYTPASQVETVGNPKLVFTTAPQSLTNGVSSGTIRCSARQWMAPC